MPKTQIVDPVAERKPRTIQSPKVHLNRYKTPIEDERKKLGDETLSAVLRDMMLIREYEEMLQSIKTEGSYQGAQRHGNGQIHQAFVARYAAPSGPPGVCSTSGSLAGPAEGAGRPGLERIPPRTTRG